MSRVPVTMEVGIRKFFCGPESFTPDLGPIVGEAPELKNYFVAAGLNSVGIITGGGLGRVLAHWILNGTADVDGADDTMIEGEPVDEAYLREGKWEVLIAGKTYPAAVSTRPLYDPAMERIKA